LFLSYSINALSTSDTANLRDPKVSLPFTKSDGIYRSLAYDRQYVKENSLALNVHPFVLNKKPVDRLDPVNNKVLLNSNRNNRTGLFGVIRSATITRSNEIPVVK
jgi:hypothetical protein